MSYKKTIFIICCSLAFGMANAQSVVTFNYTGSIVTWTVPACASQITITAIGAAGGQSQCYGYTPGYGTSMTGTFSATPGQVLKILVGQQGLSACSAGGGGGSFVTDISNNPWIIAGGGGGSGYNGYGNGNPNANTGTSGNHGGQYTYGSQAGGQNGGGGAGGINGGGGGGGGLTGNGGNGNYCGNYCGSYMQGGNGGNGSSGPGCNNGGEYGGSSFTNGGGGGTNNSCNTNEDGGFGGGGAGWDCSNSGPGGGGGYSGGSGGGYDPCQSGQNNCCGGGGGSYNNGSNQNNQSGVGTGNGKVTITGNWLNNTPSIISNVSCFGGSNGSATSAVSGPSPFIYTWAPAGGTKDTATGLSAGIYTLTVKDVNGCTASASVAITQPATPLTLSVATTANEICNGGNNGSASSVEGGGTSPYYYSWTPAGGYTDTATGLTAGTYTLKVTDNQGCIATASVAITQPLAISVTATTTANVICREGDDGSASSTVSGGTGIYTYSWSNGGNNPTVSNLTAGTYTLTVTDIRGCTGSAATTITQPVVMSVTTSLAASALCYGGNGGSASSAVNGGTSPYNYLWSNGETNATDMNLSAGTYTVTVADNCGATATSAVTVIQPIAVSGSATIIENISCNGLNNGCAMASASGGTAPYSYLWSDDNSQTTATACSLSAGTYTMKITDNNGCTGKAMETITQPAPISVITNSTIDYGNCTGSAGVTASGGNSPYSYLWADGNTTDSIYGQCAGVYCCTVTDASGCAKYVCVTVKSTARIGNLTSNSDGITVYPNPSNGQFTIVIANEANQSQGIVEVYNVLGEKVYSHLSSFNAPLSINLSNQPNGIYLYRVVTENGNPLVEGKVILQK